LPVPPMTWSLQDVIDLLRKASAGIDEGLKPFEREYANSSTAAGRPSRRAKSGYVVRSLSSSDVSELVRANLVGFERLGYCHFLQVNGRIWSSQAPNAIFESSRLTSFCSRLFAWTVTARKQMSSTTTTLPA
jgi:hypothetical protein